MTVESKKEIRSIIKKLEDINLSYDEIEIHGFPDKVIVNKEEVIAEYKDIVDELQEIEDKERGIYDLMPESVHFGSKGTKALDDIEALGRAMDNIDKAIEEIDYILPSIEQYIADAQKELRSVL